MTRTEAERLTRIEVLLEQAVVQRTEERERHAQERELMKETIEGIAADLKTIRAELADDKADLAALKNKGTGLLIGVALAGGAAGAGLSSVLEWLR
ncbi:hypothetical protein UFOVP368_25 [uncultured Caudovirales phage]|uniref:Uncharacterized protein n=1 Tax=uncultured Caudovirales phage TaxID=2100421 RepID=A0A6J7WY46_9CAUD|nr:hypothetical protein UFOVP368_25 [uncultured Caudovirales phage]